MDTFLIINTSGHYYFCSRSFNLSQFLSKHGKRASDKKEKTRAEQLSRYSGPVTCLCLSRDGLKGDRTLLLLVVMSILASSRSVLRTLRWHAATASVGARQHPGPRRLSSESKDELRVRYLDGPDSGETVQPGSGTRRRAKVHVHPSEPHPHPVRYPVTSPSRTLTSGLTKQCMGLTDDVEAVIW